MLPDHPPFPTAWNLPFHPDAGNQTSILMSESFDGASVAATRQNAGRFLKFGAGPRAGVAAGGKVNSPAVTDSASVITVSGSASDFNSSQEVDPAAFGSSNKRPADRKSTRLNSSHRT